MAYDFDHCCVVYDAQMTLNLLLLGDLDFFFIIYRMFFTNDLDLVSRSHTVILGATLSARDGHVHVPPGQVTSIACVSGTPPTGQCDMCCYGNGACNVGTCECDPGFSDSDNCGEFLMFCYQKKSRK